jgi:hypothetical protein
MTDNEKNIRACNKIQSKNNPNYLPTCKCIACFEKITSTHHKSSRDQGNRGCRGRI